MRRSPKISQRDSRNLCAFYGGATEMEQPTKRGNQGGSGRQPESDVNDAVKSWARGRRGILYRNRRGMLPLASGKTMSFGLGPNGYGDLVGYLTIQITPEMIGRHVAVFTMVESKVRGGADDHQDVYIQEVRAAGGIAGVAHNAEDAEILLLAWRAKHGC